MPSSPRGFTLLEVLFALVVLTVGLLGLAGSLGPTAALAGEGKAHGRVALLLASRLDSLRAQVRAGGTGCAPPPAGSARHPGGFSESWSTAAAGQAIDVFIEAAFVDRRGLHADTLRSLVRCP